MATISTKPSYFVGFDPGGKNAFGWAVIDQKRTYVRSNVCSTARDALEAVKEILGEHRPIALAIDAPLYWVFDGDRKADKFVRKRVVALGGESGTVGHVNSLRGACLVQGILMLKLAYVAWPEARVSEAHPKALERVCKDAKEFVDGIADLKKEPNKPDHKRDAVLAAYTALALASSSDGWADLVREDGEPFFPAGKPVSYWFPQKTNTPIPKARR